MDIEFEAKILDIDPAAVAAAIESAGGQRTTDTALMRRYVYDVTPGDASRWIRLRDTGSGASLTVKEIRHDGIDGTDEVEVEVSSFDDSNELLNRLGFRARSYQENRRTSFVLAGGRLEIDEWPLIPPYLEIEADSHEEVVRIAALLGYGEDDLTGENTVKVYARHGIDLMSLNKVSFD
ncbi:class IV adenylate cyclase [Nocardia wallacei]|uniref:class IV adenylate cyclase n=1 Tax=Nocardia wallacei TaxID=480035 RepID=UPI0024542A77|nr:CYTH domain-containing protein [Nocardia wallacei]